MKKAVLVLGIIFFLIFPATVYSKTTNGYTLTTNDNLQLTLDENGVITSLQVNNKELVNNPSPALWIRDYTPSYPIQNLIINPGFENDENHDGIADGWTPYTFNGEPDISLDASHAHSGNTSLRMFSPAASNQNQMAYISTPVEIQENTEYCLTLHAMNDFGFLGDNRWEFSMWAFCTFYDEQGEEIGEEELQIHHTMNTWKQFSKCFVSPSNARTLEVTLVFNGPEEQSIPDIEESTAWFDDICLYEMPDETKMKPIEGAPHQENNNLIFEGNSNDLQFTLDYTSQGDYIEINGNIENTYNKEKALEVYFLLPTDMNQGIWWKDIRNTQEINNGVYQFVVNADESSYLPLSPYPLSAVTNQNLGLSLAIPLSKPRIFRIFYDAESNKYGISFSFGLSPMTQFNTINFTVYLYKCNSEWGFRSALNRYYKFFPQYFNKTIGPMFMNVSNPRADFGVRCIQGHYYYDSAARKLRYLNENNTYAFEYTLPNDYRTVSIQNTSENTPDYEEFLGLLDFYTHDNNPFKSLKTRGVKNSTILDGNNDVIMSDIIKGPEWVPDKWVAGFPLNTDPELPGFNIADAMITAIIQPAFDNAEKYNARIDGVKMDNFMKASRYIDMNTSRFCYADHPLTYSPNNFKPGISGITSMIEYIDFLSNWLEEHHPGTKLVGNCLEMGASSFGFPYLSVFPFEANSIYRQNFDEVNLNYRRSMAYHRPVMAHQTAKLYDEHGHVLMEYLHPYVNMSMFYGIYPLMKGSFFNECDYETARPLYQKVIPIIDELYLAGWEPITYAETTDEKIFVERFGNGTTVYFTVGNNDSITKEYELIINAEKLGIETGMNVRELFSNINVSYTYENGNIIIHDTLKERGTKVFKISNTSFISINIVKPKKNWLYLFNTPIFPIKNTVAVGSITVETSVTSSEEITNVSFYVDNTLKHVDEEPPYRWTWSEPVFGKHEVTTVAYVGDELNASDDITIWKIG